MIENGTRGYVMWTSILCGSKMFKLSCDIFKQYINSVVFTDYRAMHFSAKRGIAITCRLSVRLSVCP